jgi:hypothetical protein
MNFEYGNYYSRREIHECIGGSMQACLPHIDGQVVCACLRKDLNPETPEVFLVGDGPDVREYANVLCQQKEPIPIFIKEDANSWKYKGKFIVQRYSEDPKEIENQKRRTGRNDITRIIYLKKTKLA